MGARLAQPVPRRRWGIAVLLGVSVLFNYFDRLALSVAGPPIRQELHLDALTLGALFIVFSWSYAVLQIPSGMILDRFGVTRVGCIGITLWGVGAAFTREISWVLFWMTVSVSALTSASSIGWSFPSLVAPRGGSGMVGAVMNTMNAAVGSVSAIVTGAIVDAKGSFAVAFVVAAAVLLAGACFYGLLMGRIEPVPDLPGRDAALATTGVRIAE